MFSKYDGCKAHITDRTNFNPHCADCWAALAQQKDEEQKEEQEEERAKWPER